jgi:hypothetical protein
MGSSTTQPRILAGLAALAIFSDESPSGQGAEATSVNVSASPGFMSASPSVHS